jgi:hypothetical protein
MTCGVHLSRSIALPGSLSFSDAFGLHASESAIE